MHPDVGSELGSALREFLSPYAKPIVAVGDESDAVWSRLCGELGVAGLLVPEAHGGLGFGPAELVAVAAELGRALVGGPFVPSAVGAVTALTSIAATSTSQTSVEEGGEPVGALLVELPAGTASAALVHVPLAEPARRVAARRDGAGLVLSGQIGPILAAPAPCALLVPVDVDGSPALALVEPSAAASVLAPMESLDLSRPAWRATFDQTPATVLAVGPIAAEAVRRAEIAVWTALGAECVGLAGHALELTVDHVRTRHQFGRPIGAFQAIQHQLADLTVRLEVARSAVTFAIRRADSGPSAAAAAAHALAVKASEAAVLITTEAIQLHGGIGYTWEFPAHYFLRRAHANAVLAGTPAQHRRALFALLDSADRDSLQRDAA